MTRAVSVLAALVLVSVARAQAQDSGATTTKSTLNGVFTEQQATRGDAIHSAACGTCHTAGAYSGQSFQNSWVGHTVFDFFDQIRNTMPNDNPSGLTRQQYADIVAYVLKLNGFPAGKDEVSTEDDSLKVIRIEAKPSPTR